MHIIFGTALITLALVFGATSAYGAADYFLKIEGIKGESKTESNTSAGAHVAPSQTKVLLQAEVETDVSVRTKDSGESDTAMKESGEKGGTADINIGVGELTTDSTAALQGVYIKIGDIKGESDPESNTNTGASLTAETEVRVSGVEVRGWDPQTKEVIEGVATDNAATIEAFGVLAAQAAAEDEQIEEVSLNFERIKWEYKSQGRLFNIIPVSFTKEIEVSTGTEARVKVRFPWYRALMNVDVHGDVLAEEITSALQNDASLSAVATSDIELESRKFQTISNVLKARHDVAMNSIRNTK